MQIESLGGIIEIYTKTKGNGVDRNISISEVSNTSPLPQISRCLQAPVMALQHPNAKLRFLQKTTPTFIMNIRSLKPSNCVSFLQAHQQEDVGIMCEPCGGKGWLLCGFCNGQKTNVKAENNRIYRRCPSCRAIGYVLCSKCKVFKCVTFPDYGDGEL